MKTREEAAAYGLTFPDSYEDRPFKDQRWQVIRVKPGKKVVCRKWYLNIF